MPLMCVKPTDTHSCSVMQQTGWVINRWHCFPGLGPQPQLEPLLSTLSLTLFPISPGSPELLGLEHTSLKCWTDSWPKYTRSHFKQNSPGNKTLSHLMYQSITEELDNWDETDIRSHNLRNIYKIRGRFALKCIVLHYADKTNVSHSEADFLTCRTYRT